MPKGDCTNQFFIDVLDCIVANTKTLLKKKDNVNENLWADLQDRSSGEITRKEDDINHMDPESLCDYLKSKYDVVDAYDDFYCSECGTRSPDISLNFCAKCGADMRGEENG